MVTTARSAPGGTKLEDGYSTKIAFAADADVSLWEKTVKPPGMDGGDAIETTDMHNTDLRTMAARALKTMTTSTLNVSYDPAVYDQIDALINENGWITVHFPDLSTLDFVGYLKSFEPGDNAEGTQPTAACQIIATNTLAGVETAFVYTAPA